MVGLEPSRTAIFRDELINLFPHDEDAKRLHQQTFTLSEFLAKNARDYQLPQLHGKALVQRHCHHQAIMGYDTDEAILANLGLDYDILDSGCCGMAGSFGFEKDHYEVSIKCGERVLLPAVRNAASETLVIADGFSCREQIAQNTDRRALHLAQVLHMALRQEDHPIAAYPETQELRQSESMFSSLSLGTVTLIGAGALLAGVWLLRARTSRSNMRLSELPKFPRRRLQGSYENSTYPRTARREDVRGRFRQGR